MRRRGRAAARCWKSRASMAGTCGSCRNTSPNCRPRSPARRSPSAPATTIGRRPRRSSEGVGGCPAGPAARCARDHAGHLHPRPGPAARGRQPPGLRQFLCPPARAAFRAPAADAGRRAAADPAEHRAGGDARPRSRPGSPPPAGVAMLAGNLVPPGAEPIAQAYAGHQFGHFIPSSATAARSCWARWSTPGGERRDIQLKGSGPTPFSRRGDGRAAVGPVLREYIVSEAMAALRHPDDARAGRRRHRRGRVPRDRAARRGADARRGEPSPRRHLPVFRRAAGPRRAAGAGRPCDRPALPGGCRRGRTRAARLLAGVVGAAGARWWRAGCWSASSMA